MCVHGDTNHCSFDLHSTIVVGIDGGECAAEGLVNDCGTSAFERLFAALALQMGLLLTIGLARFILGQPQTGC